MRFGEHNLQERTMCGRVGGQIRSVYMKNDVGGHSDNERFSRLLPDLLLLYLDLNRLPSSPSATGWTGAYIVARSTVNFRNVIRLVPRNCCKVKGHAIQTPFSSISLPLARVGFHTPGTVDRTHFRQAASVQYRPVTDGPEDFRF